MTTPLDVIRTELAGLRPRVERLEQAEALLAPDYETVRPVPTPRAPVRRVKRSSRRGGSVRDRVLAHIAEHGSAARAELIAALACAPATLDGQLKRSVKLGELIAEGERGARRYRLPATPVAVEASVPRPSAPTGRPERGVYPMHDVLDELGHATTAELAERLGVPTDIVVEQGRRLLRLGLVTWAGDGERRVWAPATMAEVAA